MRKFRKIVAVCLAAATLAGGVAVSTPAAAWRRWSWGAPATAAGVIGGLALGADATASPYSYPYAYPYPYNYAGHGCIARHPVYDEWGGFAGYQRMRVAC